MESRTSSVQALESQYPKENSVTVGTELCVVAGLKLGSSDGISVWLCDGAEEGLGEETEQT